MVILSCDEHLRSTCYLLGTVLSTRLRLGSHFIAWGQRHERWENGREHVSILSLDSGKRYDHLYKQRWKVESEGVFFSRGLLWALGFKHVWCFAVVGTQEAAPWTVALGHQTSLKQAEHIASSFSWSCMCHFLKTSRSHGERLWRRAWCFIPANES